MGEDRGPEVRMERQGLGWRGRDEDGRKQGEVGLRMVRGRGEDGGKQK